jgi:hypothetical protein
VNAYALRAGLLPWCERPLQAIASSSALFQAVNGRRATPSDAEPLHALRATQSWSSRRVACPWPREARAWAAKGDLESIPDASNYTEIWLAEIDAVIAGCIGVRDDYLDASTTTPHTRAVASALTSWGWSKALSALAGREPFEQM